MAKQTVPPLPLPQNWPQKVRSAAVYAIALTPATPVHVRRGQPLKLVVTHLAGHRHLPIVELKKAA